MRRERTNPDRWGVDRDRVERQRVDRERVDRDDTDSPAPAPGSLHRPPLERVERRERLTTRAGLVAFVAIVAAFVLFVGATLSGRLFPSPTARPTIAVPATVDLFERIDATDAYVVAGTAVYTTRDGGVTWTQGGLPVPEPLASLESATPGIGGAATGTNRIDVPYSISFVDASHGWVAEAAESRGASAGQSSAITIYATEDGGHSWRGVAAPNVRGSGLRLQFTDTYHGWLEVFQTDAVRAFRTADGGGSWDEIAAPHDPRLYSAPVYTSEVEGWVVEAAAKASDSSPLRVRHTIDGGSTWTVTSIDLRGIAAGTVQRIGTPVRRGQTVELTAVLCTGACPEKGSGDAGGSPSGSPPPSGKAPSSAPAAVERHQVVTLTSADSGRTWSVASPREAPAREGEQVADVTLGALSTVDRTPVVVETWASGDAKVSFDLGISWRAYSFGGLPHPVVATSWASPEDVWALTSSDDGSMLLYASSDGARSWRPLLGTGTLQAIP